MKQNKEAIAKIRERLDFVKDMIEHAKEVKDDSLVAYAFKKLDQIDSEINQLGGSFE